MRKSWKNSKSSSRSRTEERLSSVQALRPQKFARYVVDVAAFARHRVIHLPHFGVGNFARQVRRSPLALRDNAPACPRARWARRRRAGSSACRLRESTRSRAASNPSVEFPAIRSTCLSSSARYSKPEIENSWRRRESQAVGARQARIAVGALHEFVAETRRAIAACMPRPRDSVFRLQAARVFAANHDRERVVESERRQHVELESLLVFALHAVEDRRSGSLSTGSCRMAVSAVPVYSTYVSMRPAEHRLLADVSCRPDRSGARRADACAPRDAAPEFRRAAPARENFSSR